MFRKILWMCITIVFPQSHLQKFLNVCSSIEFQSKLTPQIQTKMRMFYPFYYKDPFVRDCIIELKERNSHDVARLFGEILAGWIVRTVHTLNIETTSTSFPRRRESSLYSLDPRLRGDDVAEVFRRDDVLTKSNFYIVPIPQHKSKTKEKGFCHTSTLAKTIHSIITKKYPDISISVLPCIVKHTKTKQLHNTKGKKRRFALIKNTMSTHITKENAENSYFFLIDDVYTTGATFKEARRSLKDCAAPDEHIFYISIAH